jgi:nucleoid-associated protein YgaU
VAYARSVYERFGKSALAGSDQTARRHIYKGAETFPSIAAYECNTGYDSEIWRQIAEYNSIDDLDNVTAGTALIIPQINPTS